MRNIIFKKSYPLSAIQAGVLFQSLYNLGKGEDVRQLVCRLPVDLDLGALESAWQQIWRENDVLCTSFDWQKADQPIQYICENIVLPWSNLDWQNSVDTPQALLEKFLLRDRLQAFKLDQPPLIRLALIKAPSDNSWLVLSFHSILLDSASLQIIFWQLAQSYQAHIHGEKAELPSLRPYQDYVSWQTQQDLTKAREYWQNALGKLENPSPFGMVCHTTREAARDLNDDGIKTIFPLELTASLKTFVEQHKLTLHSLFQGAWAILLKRYGGKESGIVFGTLHSGLHAASNKNDADKVVGPFSNILPVYVQVDLDAPALEILKAQQNKSLELHGSLAEQLSLAEIQKIAETNHPGVRLFDTILTFEDHGVHETLINQHEMFKQWDFEIHDRTGYPLAVTVYGGEQIQIKLEYSRELLDAESAQRVLGHLQTLVEAIVKAPFTPLSQLTFMPKAELRQILMEWNDTKAEYPREKCIHEMIEEQVEKTPDAIAIIFDDQLLTYKDLDQRANQLAHHLQGLGIRPGDKVGICIERSIQMVVGMLGILKAGASYIPLDPAFPMDRLFFMIEDAGIKTLLTQEKLLALFEHKIKSGITYLCLDQDWGQIGLRPNTSPRVSFPSSNLAYIIYTSGSTGKPKGVQISHRSVVNFLISMAQRPGLSASDNVLAITTISFDIAALELFLPLTIGAKLVIARREVSMDAHLLETLLKEADITLMQATPTTWQILLSNGWQGKSNLRILCGGEALPTSLARELLTRCAELWNMYGPTETTIWSTTEQITDDRVTQTIGWPINNTQIYILDSHLQPVPIGVSGEIYIGGDGLASAYLNQPELSEAKFVPNPFGLGRIYKTGDMGRHLPDGNIEFLGRADHQIKIRGFRIEAGEIETVICQHEAVQKAVVVAMETAARETRLIAYLVLNENQTDKKSEIVSPLRNFLKQKLPEYMIPKAFVILDAFPLTPNGKINRKALPEPEFSSSAREEFVPLQTPLEETIGKIWSEILGVDEISANDNFFDLGGDSLLATRLFAQIRTVTSLELPLKLLFESPTIADLALKIENVQWAATQISAGFSKSDIGLENITL
jgi:amino acid adenylation domain-containing protein